MLLPLKTLQLLNQALHGQTVIVILQMRSCKSRLHPKLQRLLLFDVVEEQEDEVAVEVVNVRELNACVYTNG